VKRIIGYVLLLTTVTGTYYLLPPQDKLSETQPDLTTPSPLLGQTVANALHQAMSDPYLIPLERAVEYLNRNPVNNSIELSMLAGWAIDAEFPTFFTYNYNSTRFSYDKPTSLWAIDKIKTELYRKIFNRGNSRNYIIDILEIEGKRWWIGAINIPDHSNVRSEIIGVIFNIDSYLKEHIPRFIDKVVLKKRFPLVSFQTSSFEGSLAEGNIAIRILDDQKRTYLQRGHNFEPEFLIYAESQWYDNTVVCLNKGWDLQIFSSVPMAAAKTEHVSDKKRIIMLSIMLGLISIIYWWSTIDMQKKQAIK